MTESPRHGDAVVRSNVRPSRSTLRRWRRSPPTSCRRRRPWQYEPKWDGFRCLAFKAGDEVELRAKSGKPLGRYFPKWSRCWASLRSTDFVLDGEFVIEVDGRLSFDALQMRLHPAESRFESCRLKRRRD